MTFEELTQKIEALEAKASEAVSVAEADHSKFEEQKALIDNEIKPEIERLQTERNEIRRDEEFKGLKEGVERLQGVMNELRKPGGGFTIGSLDLSEGKAAEDGPYADGGEFSYFADVRLANKGNQDAKERLIANLEGLNAEGKAMTEG